MMISLISSIVLINYYGKRIKPNLIKYGESETKRIITIIINNTIHNITKDNLDLKSIIKVEKNNQNQINSIDFDSQKITKIEDYINRNIYVNIKAIENGKLNQDINIKEISKVDYEEIQNGIIYYIPYGNITNNILINNIGPKIPIKFTTSGEVTSNIDTKVKEYGINNALIEVSVKVSVTMIINMPFVGKEVTVKNKVPIFMKIIQGELPNYYLTNT